MLIENIGKYPRYNELKSFIMDFYEEHDLHNSGQYALQGKDKHDGQFCCLRKKFGGTFTGHDDRTHSTLLEIFEGTEIETLFNWLSGYTVCRSRIFVLGQGNKSEYGIHTDPTKRLHVPIITNESCGFNFYDENKNLVYTDFLPADGSVYIVDTTVFHNTQNTAAEDRIHVVCSYYD